MKKMLLGIFALGIPLFSGCGHFCDRWCDKHQQSDNSHYPPPNYYQQAPQCVPCYPAQGTSYAPPQGNWNQPRGNSPCP
ncbi:MAG: hypothetical protein EXR99_01980 [Gemmataceae bacterium]|nr:hypothetical protein [Gemmataceae bacterium]